MRPLPDTVIVDLHDCAEVLPKHIRDVLHPGDWTTLMHLAIDQCISVYIHRPDYCRLDLRMLRCYRRAPSCRNMNITEDVCRDIKTSFATLCEAVRHRLWMTLGPQAAGEDGGLDYMVVQFAFSRVILRRFKN